MVKMTTVWERTSDFLRDHARVVLPVTAGLIFLPNLVTGMFEGSTPVAPALAAVFGIVAILGGVIVLWGGAAITALAIRPSPAGPAISHALRRLLPLIGVSIVVVLGVIALMVPLIGIMVAGGLNLSALATPGASMPQPGAGTVGAAMLYLLAAAVLMLWLFARLSVLGSVVLAERLGLGAFARSWELTRGHALRIIGVVLLYSLLAGILMMAVGAVAGLLGVLISGGAQGFGPGTVIVAFASAIVSAVVTVVQSAFVGKLYTQLAPAAELQETFG